MEDEGSGHIMVALRKQAKKLYVFGELSLGRQSFQRIGGDCDTALMASDSVEPLHPLKKKKKKSSIL
ncbi:hypothetical protein CsSME_00041933 [Camellia sinensis var. sinensis]